MSATHAICDECSAPVAADVLEGLCPRCLLTTAMRPEEYSQAENGADSLKEDVRPSNIRSVSSLAVWPIGPRSH
jgi:hypothetical protein